MRKLIALTLGIGIVSLPGIAVVSAKAQSIDPPHTRNTGNPHQTLEPKKRLIGQHTGGNGSPNRPLKRRKHAKH